MLLILYKKPRSGKSQGAARYGVALHEGLRGGARIPDGSDRNGEEERKINTKTTLPGRQ